MQELRKKSIDFMYKVFANDCLDDSLLKFESDYFNTVVDKIYNNLIKNKKSVKNPFLLKLGGQSGSGKTTQLLPSISEAIDSKYDYIHIAVRSFAKYHPQYNELLEKHGESLIREKTNGFALLCLFAVAEKLIKNKFNILFEVTLLDPDFEEYFAKLAKNYGYKIIYNILSIPLEISNGWIIDRLNNSEHEKNRIVSQANIDFFYNILPLAIERIIDLKDVFNSTDYMVLWNTIESNPILITNNFTDDILVIFNKFRSLKNIDNITIVDKHTSLNYKKNFYKKFLNEVL